MDCNYGEVHCDSVKIADRSDSLRVHHKHVPWKIILVSYTRPLFRSTKANYFIGQLWQLLTASNVGACTQAWQAKWAVFKILGFVCKRFLPFFHPHPLSALLLVPLFARSLTLIPRSLFLNRTETLATQAKLTQEPTPDVFVAISPGAACSLLSVNYCWGQWTTGVVIELLSGHWTN